jgi:hypothetical protein
MAKGDAIPQPGPARLSKGAGPDEWLEQAKQCKYLPEADMKWLCEIVKECLMEGESLILLASLFIVESILTRELELLLLMLIICHMLAL